MTCFCTSTLFETQAVSTRFWKPSWILRELFSCSGQNVFGLPACNDHDHRLDDNRTQRAILEILKSLIQDLSYFTTKLNECVEIQDNSFDANLILAWISVHLTKLTLKSFPTREGQMDNCIRNALTYCRRTPLQHEERLAPVVRHLVVFMNRLILSRDGFEFIGRRWPHMKVDDHVNHISVERVAREAGI